VTARSPSLPALRPRAVVITAALALVAAACVPLAPPAPLPPTYGPNPPVHGADLPDPMIATAPGAYTALATNQLFGPLVPSAGSSDLRSWTLGPDALLRQPSWADTDPDDWLKYWAPAAHQFGATWVLYFTAPSLWETQCIGVATATAAQGPYTPVDTAPFVCQPAIGGSIDPSVTVDAAGNPWLLWKGDGNCCNLPVHIYSQQLTADGLGLVGTPTAILGVDQGWEDGSSNGAEPWKRLIEGPSMVFRDNVYWLFYSANWWEGVNYAVGYAKCTSPAGGCSKPRDGPILKGSLQGAGPGGQEIFTDAGGQLWLVYHSWAFSAVGYGRPGAARTMRLSRLSFANGEPVLGGGP
jgi:beta-xylosidase